MTWMPRVRLAVCRSHFPLLLLLLSVPALARASTRVPGETLEQRFTFAPGDLVLAPAADGAVTVGLKHARLAAPALGSPALPEVPLLFVIPADRTVIGIEAVVEGEAPEPGGVTVAPATELTADGERSVPVPAGWQEGPVAERAGEGYLRGWKLAAVTFRPVRYDPARGALSLVTSVRVVLTLGPAAPGTGPLARVRERTALGERVRGELAGIVANPGALASASWRGGGGIEEQSLPGDFAPTARPTADGSAVDYVIVTVDSLAAAFQAFADWKTSVGQQAVVRTTSWITATYPGGADLAETIRTFLQDAYTNWGAYYVLLGGDAALVPYRLGRTTYYGGEDIPADLYFQCLDGNWNADGDSLYGEGGSADGLSPGDGADLYPEVFAGRVTANNVADVNTWVAKTKQFAQSAPADFATRVLFASEVLFPSTWQSPADGEPSLDGADITEDAYALLPPSVQAVRLYQRYGSYSGSLVETKQATVDQLNAGCMLWEHMGHGYRNTLSLGDASMINADADGLTNSTRQGVVYAVNCNSASFEYNSIAERFLFNTHGGAVAYVGATRYDFPTTVWGYQTEFFRLLFRDTTDYTLGAAAALSKAGYAPYAFADGSHRWTQFALVLLGDPALTLYWRAPRALTVSLPALTVGEAPVTATVRANGAPVARACVTLWKTGEAYASGLTDASGAVTLAFSPRTAGSVSVGVAAMGDWTSVTSATVSATSLPAIVPGTLTVLDASGGGVVGNGDGIANPGETVDVRLPLTNAGGATATSVSATLATGDWHVRLIDSVSTYGTVTAGQTATGDGFRVAIDTTAADGRTVRAIVTVRDGAGHVWQHGVDVGIASAVLAIAGRTLADTIGADNRNGIAEAGETVAYRLLLQNRGSGAASGLVVHLAPADATTQVLDGTQVFAGDLAAHASGTGDDWMTFQTLANGTHRMSCWITDARGRTLLSRPLDLDAPPPPTNLHALGAAADIALVWSAPPVGDVYGYAIYRAIASGGSYARINTFADVGTAYYRDEGLPSFSRFYYEVAAIDSSGNESAASAEIASTTNPPLHVGWPVGMGRGTPSSPVVSNIDNSGDGSLDIVVGADKVYALHADGSELRDGDANPQTLGPFAAAGEYVAASCAISDLNGDGHPDIVAPSFNSALPPADSTTVWVLDGVTGGVLPGWPRVIPKFGWSTPALGDIDGDGQEEIVMGSTDGWIYAWHGDGTSVRSIDPTVPGRFYDTNVLYLYSSPALADIDHDGRLDIVIGASAGNGYTGRLLVLRWDGSSAPGFPYTEAGMGSVTSSPAVAQLFTSGPNAGKYQIVFGSDENVFRCLNEDGSELWRRYPQQTTWSRSPSPAIGDVDGDGALDVVVNSTNGLVFAMRGTTGADLPGWPVPYGTGTSYVSECSPVLADLDGDGHVDVLVGAEDGKLYGIRHDGSAAAGFPIALRGEVRGSPLVWDVDGDGLAEIALAGWDQTLYVWDLPAPFSAPATAPWPMFHHDVRHTGRTGQQFLRSPFEATAVRPAVVPLSLDESAPNPWRGATTIAFTAPGEQGGAPVSVSLRVFDAAGRLVRTVADAPLVPGPHSARWDGRRDDGSRAGRGVYFYRVSADGRALVRRTVLLP